MTRNKQRDQCHKLFQNVEEKTVKTKSSNKILTKHRTVFSLDLNIVRVNEILLQILAAYSESEMGQMSLT